MGWLLYDGTSLGRAPVLSEKRVAMRDWSRGASPTMWER
jgi:hypothetical protein